MATYKNFEPTSLGTFSVRETTSASVRWKKYVTRFENMMEAYEIKDDKRMKVLLLHQSGEEIFNIYSSLENHKAWTFEQTHKNISNYFNPKKCTEYEVHKIRKCFQAKEKTTEEFLSRLQELAENCEFENKKKEIKTQIIHKCKSDKLRKKALQQAMSLEEIVSLERAMEISSARALEMSSQYEHLNKVDKKKPRKESSWQKKCYRCGNNWPHRGECPAIGKICTKCSKPNHFSKQCKSNLRINSTNGEEFEDGGSKFENLSSNEESF